MAGYNSNSYTGNSYTGNTNVDNLGKDTNSIAGTDNKDKKYMLSSRLPCYS